MNISTNSFGLKKSSIDVDPAHRTNEGFRFRANKIQRVQEAIEKNSICESSPNRLHQGNTYEKIMNLRPREQHKELDGQFRFQPRSSVEKVIDSFQNRNPLCSIRDKDIFSENLVKRNKHGVILKKNFDIYRKTINSKEENPFTLFRKSQQDKTNKTTIDQPDQEEQESIPIKKPRKLLLEPKKLFP